MSSEGPPPPFQAGTSLSIAKEGMVITATLAPGMTLTIRMNEETMNQATAHWLESRRQIKRELAIVQEAQSKVR